MGDDIKWFFGLLIAFALLWFGGGQLNRESAKHPFIKPLNPVSTGETYGRDPLSGLSSGKTGSGKSIISGTNSPSSSNSVSGSNTTTGTNGQSSNSSTTKTEDKPVIKKLKINSVRFSYNEKVNDEYIIIRADSSNTEPVSITDMVLRSKPTGKQATIKKATKLPFPGTSGGYDDVILKPGELAYIITGNSPNGFSFQTNTCTGYFAQSTRFTPGLRYDCPRPINEPLPEAPNSLPDKCLDYIERLPSCTTVTTPPLWLTPNCSSFVLETANYKTCVANHKDDKNFYRGEWYVYLNRSYTLWKSRREEIELVDKDGTVLSSIKFN